VSPAAVGASGAIRGEKKKIKKESKSGGDGRRR